MAHQPEAVLEKNLLKHPKELGKFLSKEQGTKGRGTRDEERGTSFEC